MNKALIESLLRHILGAGLASLTAVMAASGVVSPLELQSGDWLVVVAALWGAAVPPVIRYLNTKDPAFGRVAEDIAEEVALKIKNAAKSSPKAPAKKPSATGKTGSVSSGAGVKKTQ